MTIARRIPDLVRNGGLRTSEYESARPHLIRQNRRLLNASLVTGVLLLSIVLIASFFVSSIATHRVLYTGTLSAFVVMLIVLRLLPKANEFGMLLLFYLFFLVVYTFGLILGVFEQPSMTATTFCVMLFALPLLITDRPWRVALLLVIVCVVFCFASSQVKDARIASIDTVNALSFLFLGIVINTIMMNIKLKEALHATIVERERDTDELTKLYTKAATTKNIRHHLGKHDGHGALMVIDVDNFKTVNDSMGHAYGDAVLRLVSNALRETFRERDVLGRFGGDEFVVFLPDTRDYHVIEKRAEHLISALEKQFSSDTSAQSVTCSIGIAFFPDNAQSYDELFENADAALYKAKEQGKNRFAFYADGTGENH